MTDCASIRASVAALLTRPGATISASVASHIAGCAVCRGALALLAAELVPMPPVVPILCDDADLAGFLDLEGEAGTLAAVQEQPGTWWHLWLCDDCATAYARFQTLREA